MPQEHHPLVCRRAPIVWLYGLSGAGKSTLASLLINDLRDQGRPVVALDGDALRTGLSRGLGFSPVDRTENLRRAAETAKLIADAGVAVVCSFITPLNEQRRMIRDIAGHPLLDVYVECPFEVCASRDVKGLYRTPPPNFTGIDSTFEEPDLRPTLTVNTSTWSVEHCAAQLLAYAAFFGA